MSQKEDLSEVTVSQTVSSWELDRGKESNQCERRLLTVLLASVLLLFIIIASLVCTFWLLIFPKFTAENKGTGGKFAVHILADRGPNETVRWSATPGLGRNHLGSGFRFENQKLQTTRDGMYYVYAKLKVYCSVLNECKNSSPVKLDITHCIESSCLPVLSTEMKVSQEKGQEEQVAFGYSGILVQISSKGFIQAKIEGLQKEDNVMLDIDHTYFGAFLIES
ncbi:uncharacterized protein LOC122540166 [Chiloscyllium plagiosum]|uniref:uncharacterized protein LOC122540166 n=1 Tax=Chiloscyllium plagiosum TaxID=36176 RepID=UPI001CB7C482|nr:uncharacterized protein LOC122540166 [Chiloscyllium plagiosum]